ncbi:DUF2550 family protein [Nocardioides mangrovicus]|uniref:DUF2550 family protein n=1 Tax=Nocardioides mangrovicus TaxID=2478913 RepID=A0A3L8P8X4_9ACTN|nr:DUF2550 domain-containing protein [Nocardioides mangrovicus]RLV51038.1 DUF2550 family protein [Nocardioides mangrovicus]
MALWQWLVDSAGFVLLLVLVYAVGLVVRRRLLSRHGGTFELSVRTPDADSGRGWILGLGRYGGEDVEWFRIFSLSPWPKRTWYRGHLAYESQRPSADNERFTLYEGHVVVVCRTDDGPVEMAMSPSALTGLQSWLEAAPPGAGARREPS